MSRPTSSNAHALPDITFSSVHTGNFIDSSHLITPHLEFPL